MVDAVPSPDGPGPRRGWFGRAAGVLLGLFAAGRTVAAPPTADEAADGHGQPVHPQVAYERRDVRFTSVLLVLVLAGALGLFIHAAIWGFYTAFSYYQDRVKRSPYPLAPAPMTALPPEPRLEELDRLAGNERPNVYVRQEDREKILNSSGATRDPGFVHIPIERAMDLVVKQLPVRPESQQSAVRDNGLIDGGESNSGRMFRGR